MADINIDHHGLKISLDFSDLVETLDREDKMKLAKAVCWDEVLQEAIMRLAGQSENWQGDDSSLSFEFLKDQILDEALRIKFNAFAKARRLIQDTLYESRLYWALYHDRSLQERYGFNFSNWAKANGFEESNFCDKSSEALANDITDKIRAIMVECLQKEKQNDK